MTEFALRPYQDQCIDGLRRAIALAKKADVPPRVVLCAPTGAGKTVLGAYLMAESRGKDKRCSFVVDRTALADQTSDTLNHYGITHGVLQGANSYSTGAPAMVVSAMTAKSRGWPRDMDLLLVDECHTLYKTTREHIMSRLIPVIGLTATPFANGMSELYPAGIVNVCTTDQLVDDGYLARLKVYAAKEIDVSGVKVTAGEWNKQQLEGRALQIIGDIVAEWSAKTLEHFGGPVKTICFSASIAHGEELCRQFGAAGHRFEQVHAGDNDDRRRALIEEFRKPDSDITGLVSVEALAKGFDVPDILCGIGARPYRKSLSSHIQQLGRAMRAHPGKDYALWLDHCVASGQRVLTSRGLVPIEKVHIDDLLWDGIEWVRHEGLKNAGIQKVITYSGLTATPDHLVATRRGWMAFGQAAEKQEPIIETGFGGAEIRVCEDCFSGRGMAGAEGWAVSARSLRVPGMRLPGDNFTVESEERENERLPALQSAATSVSGMVGATGPRHGSALSKPERLQLERVRGEGDRIQVQEAKGGMPMDHRKPRHPRQPEPGYATGSYRQRRALRARQPEMGYAGFQLGEYPGQQMDCENAPVQTGTPECSICGQHAARTLVRRTVLQRDRSKVASAITETERQVWDLRQAGPRNRFTCEGFLVHNSGNYLRFQAETEAFWASGCDELQDGREKPARELTEQEKRERICACGAIIPGGAENCPACGREVRRKATVETVNGTLVAIGESRQAALRDVWREICGDAWRRKHPDRAAAKRFATAQFKSMFGEWPSRAWEFHPGHCSNRIERLIMHQVIKFAKRRAA